MTSYEFEAARKTTAEWIRKTWMKGERFLYLYIVPDQDTPTLMAAHPCWARQPLMTFLHWMNGLGEVVYLDTDAALIGGDGMRETYEMIAECLGNRQAMLSPTERGAGTLYVPSLAVNVMATEPDVVKMIEIEKVQALNAAMQADGGINSYKEWRIRQIMAMKLPRPADR